MKESDSFPLKSIHGFLIIYIINVFKEMHGIIKSKDIHFASPEIDHSSVEIYCIKKCRVAWVYSNTNIVLNTLICKHQIETCFKLTIITYSYVRVHSWYMRMFSILIYSLKLILF